MLNSMSIKSKKSSIKLEKTKENERKSEMGVGEKDD